MINKILRKITYLKDDIMGGGYNFFETESLQIENTINCNLNCTICDDEMKTRSERKMIDLAAFKKIVDQFKYLKSLNLTGFGESLLNPDIFDIMKYAKSKNIKTELATNCTLLSDDKARKLINSGLDTIIFSVDSGVPEIYNKIRVGSDFEKIKVNIKNFIKIKKELNSNINTTIYSVVIFSQLENLEKLIDLGEELGVTKIVLRALVNHNGRGLGYSKDALYHPDNAVIANEKIESAKEYAKNKNMQLICPKLFARNDYQCKMPSTRPFISVEGLVTPCCVQGMDPRNINFGNIHEEDFSAIWNNDKYRDFRKNLYSGKNHPSICRHCPRRVGLA